MKTRIDYSRHCTEGKLVYVHAPEELDTFFVDWHLILPPELVLNRMPQTTKIDSFTMVGPPFCYMHLQIYLLEGVLANTRLQVSTATKISAPSLRPLADVILGQLEKSLLFKKMDFTFRQQVNDFVTVRMASHVWWYKTLAQGTIKKN